MCSIKKISNIKKNGFEDSELVLNLSGKYVNNTVVNCLRRVAFQFVPTYNFCRDTINITKNTTIYNNDELKLRFEQICIYLKDINITSNIDFLDKIYWKNIDYTNKEFIKHKEDNLKIEMFIDLKNDTDNIINVTTNNCIVYVNDEKVEIFDKKYPELLLKMKPKDEFSCRAKAVLNIGERSNIWSSIRNCFFEILDDNSFNLTVQSMGQINEKNILIKSCEIIKYKINKLKEWMKTQKNKFSDPKYNVFEIIDENHTIGELITIFLQDHKNVIYCGGSKPDLLVNNYLIKTSTSDNKYLETNIEVLNNIYKLYDDIEKKIKQI
jgi:DNA-directed RNA polymerase subunit L